MTSFTTTHSSTIAPRTAAAAGTTATALAALLALLFAHGWREVAVVVPVLVAVAAWVFGYVVPRALRRAETGGIALALALPAALLVVPAFWSGLPLVLGVAAVIVGNHGRHGRTRPGAAIAALALGALTVVFFLSIYVMEAIAGNTGFLFDLNCPGEALTAARPDAHVPSCNFVRCTNMQV